MNRKTATVIHPIRRDEAHLSEMTAVSREGAGRVDGGRILSNGGFPR